jgi:hypothetical protein
MALENQATNTVTSRAATPADLGRRQFIREKSGPDMGWRQLLRSPTLVSSGAAIRAFNNHAQLAPPPVTLDLRVIAKHVCEGAASTDEDCRSQAVGLFISDSVAGLDRNG